MKVTQILAFSGHSIDLGLPIISPFSLYFPFRKELLVKTNMIWQGACQGFPGSSAKSVAQSMSRGPASERETMDVCLPALLIRQLQ